MPTTGRLGPWSKGGSMGRQKTLNEWYRDINTCYFARNFYRSTESLFCHLAEVVGGLSTIATRKKKGGVDAESFLVKTLTWWMALCGKAGLREAEDLIWLKFPDACPYCEQKPCLDAGCKPAKGDDQKASRSPHWRSLHVRGGRLYRSRPGALSEWQRMFAEIYPQNVRRDPRDLLSRLAEEMGELAEAIRLLPLTPAFFINESIDVFAWIMAIANHIDPRADQNPEERGVFLDEAFVRSYSSGCPECEERLCACAPIMPSKVGRLAQEIPEDEFAGLQGLVFSSQDYIETFGSAPGLTDTITAGDLTEVRRPGYPM
jgi:NTP pyrophosphatase (non-canonical NTP hydrolase)